VTAIRALRFALVVAVMIGGARTVAGQASQRGQPQTPFALADFAKLRWLEGNWIATSQGEPTMYERFHFADDSTVNIVYYRDAGFSQEAANGKLYLSVGRVYHSFGPNRWGATHVGADGVFLVPQANAHNTFGWDYKGPDEWTSTTRTGLSGHERVTVWDMKRIK
jgi:hypothetical protein